MDPRRHRTALPCTASWLCLLRSDLRRVNEYASISSSSLRIALSMAPAACGSAYPAMDFSRRGWMFMAKFLNMAHEVRQIPGGLLGLDVFRQWRFSACGAGPGFLQLYLRLQLLRRFSSAVELAAAVSPLLDVGNITLDRFAGFMLGAATRAAPGFQHAVLGELLDPPGGQRSWATAVVLAHPGLYSGPPALSPPYWPPLFWPFRPLFLRHRLKSSVPLACLPCPAGFCFFGVGDFAFSSSPFRLIPLLGGYGFPAF